jgi:hypothetical protein
MSAEKINLDKIGVPQERQGHVRTWEEMKGFLTGLVGQEVEDWDPTNRRFLETYFNIQNFIVRHELDEAKKLFNDELRSRKEYSDFEDSNKFLLIAIDIAVKNKTGWLED